MWRRLGIIRRPPRQRRGRSLTGRRTAGDLWRWRTRTEPGGRTRTDRASGSSRRAAIGCVPLCHAHLPCPRLLAVICICPMYKRYLATHTKTQEINFIT